MKFKQEVEKLFSGISNYSENEKWKSVSFNVECEFNAESLFKLSDLLGTGTIYSCPEAHRNYGCPTCDGDLTTYISISASEVKF